MIALGALCAASTLMAGAGIWWAVAAVYTLWRDGARLTALVFVAGILLCIAAALGPFVATFHYFGA